VVLDHAADVVSAFEHAPDRLSLSMYEAGSLYLERARNLLALGLTLEAARYLTAARRVAKAYDEAPGILDEVARLFRRISQKQSGHF
jgi:hypothetical protein